MINIIFIGQKRSTKDTKISDFFWNLVWILRQTVCCELSQCWDYS